MDNLNVQQNKSIPFHTHNSVDGTPYLDGRYSIINIPFYIQYRIVANGTNTTVANVVGGDYVMPFNGYIVGVGATVDTAGTTNVTTIDINKNGTSIMNTKITIDSSEKTSRTGATQNVLIPSSTSFVVGDIFTFDVDAISTTPAKGLTIFMNVIITK